MIGNGSKGGSLVIVQSDHGGCRAAPPVTVDRGKFVIAEQCLYRLGTIECCKLSDQFVLKQTHHVVEKLRAFVLTADIVSVLTITDAPTQAQTESGIVIPIDEDNRSGAPSTY